MTLVFVGCLVQQHAALSAPAEVIDIAYHAYDKATGKLSSAKRQTREDGRGKTHFSFEKRGKLIYVGTRNKARENTIMGAVGTLDLSAPKTCKLPEKDQTRDFHQE